MKKILIPVLLVAVSLSACQSKKGEPYVNKLAGSSNNQTPPPDDDSTPTPPPPLEEDGDPDSVAAVPTSAGMRNFEQIHYTLASLTGVEGNTTVINRYNNLRSQLPSENDIRAFSFSGQIAITVLAAEYCNALVTGANYATQRTAALGAINLNAAPTVALDDAGKSAVAQSMLNKFWGSGFATLPNAATTQAGVISLITDLVAGANNNATTTRNAVIGACTAILASSPVSML